MNAPPQFGQVSFCTSMISTILPKTISEHWARAFTVTLKGKKKKFLEPLVPPCSSDFGQVLPLNGLERAPTCVQTLSRGRRDSRKPANAQKHVFAQDLTSASTPDSRKNCRINKSKKLMAVNPFECTGDLLWSYFSAKQFESNRIARLCPRRRR